MGKAHEHPPTAETTGRGDWRRRRLPWVCHSANHISHQVSAYQWRDDDFTADSAVSALHLRTVQSSLAVRTRRPSALKQASATAASCRNGPVTGCPLTADHTCAVTSALAVTSERLSGLKAASQRRCPARHAASPMLCAVLASRCEGFDQLNPPHIARAKMQGVQSVPARGIH